MIVRHLNNITGTNREVFAENRNWVSRRLLLKDDGMGFSYHDTIIFAGTQTYICYKNHVEAVYCIEGEGEVEVIDTGKKYKLNPGTLYALDQHDRHYLRASKDMRILCVFNPPLSGREVHLPDGSYPADEDYSYFVKNQKKDNMVFAFLNLKDQPRGNYMLDCLIRDGFVPALIIEENSSLADSGRQTLTNELKKIEAEIPPPRPLEEIIAGRNIHHIEVDNHNSEESERILMKLCPDLIVLGDTRIIKKSIIIIPNMGIINVHPGYLPDVRGNNPYLWAIIHDLYQGVTVHFIDENIDTGPMIMRQKIMMKPKVSYPYLLAEINRVCGELLKEVMRFIIAGGVHCLPQDNFKAPLIKTFPKCPSGIKSQAVQKLESGEYLFDKLL
jgi:L-ectoine synthase